jgi:2-hydroxy-3-oxopropionate reductase
MANVAFIGLGNMGGPMAQNQIKAGHTVRVFDLSQPALDAAMAAGASIATSAADAAAGADCVITMLPAGTHVRSTIVGGGVIDAAKKGAILIDCSTIDVPTAREVIQASEDKGRLMVDAPVSGGDIGAKAGTLTIMVGGTSSGFERIQPLFELMGKNITHVGGHGDGQTAKVANQIIVALNIEAVAEALLFAARAGADPAKVRQALMGGFASSRILEVHGERMIKRTFDPGFRIELHQKDLNLALSAARSLGLSLPNTANAQQLFSSCVAHGGKAWDHSAMVKALEGMANFEMG